MYIHYMSMCDTQPSCDPLCRHLLASSMCFITNAISAYMYEYYLYSFLFGTLTFTSLFYHTSNTFYTNLMDKMAIASIVMYGAYVLYLKQLNALRLSVVVAAFMACILFFYYGYCTNQYCYHPDKSTGNMYHSLLHVVSSIGHHCIVLF